MMMRANVPGKHRHRMFVLAVDCATVLDGLSVIDVNDTSISVVRSPDSLVGCAPSARLEW